MAGEITTGIILRATKNGALLASVATTNGSVTGTAAAIDMTGNEGTNETQVIPTSWTAVTMGAVSIAGAYLYIKNIDSTNYVELSMASDGTAPFSKLKAGQEDKIQGPATGTMYARANTASVRIQKVFLSE